MTSGTKSNSSVVAMLEVRHNGKQVIVPVAVGGFGFQNGIQMDVNTISSVYEKSVKSLVTEAIAQENAGDIGIFYAKKEAMTLPGAGVQFPVQLQQSIASNGIIHRFSEKVNMNISENVQRWKAKINAGADGNVFELVENAQYDGSQAEQGKALASHNGVRYWDYFVKDVQIDGSVFNLLANVRQKKDGAFVYSIQLNEDKKRTASPPLNPRRASNGVTNTVENTIAQQEQNVKQKYSRELDSEYMELAKDPEGNSTELTVEQMAYDVMARAAGLNRQKATKADQAVERATEELNRLLKAGRTRERARIEQNQQTTHRQQIKNVSEKFQRMLLRPGKGATQHAPANLVGAVRSFCELFNDSEMRRAARWQLTLDSFLNYVCGCI